MKTNKKLNIDNPKVMVGMKIIDFEIKDVKEIKDIVGCQYYSISFDTEVDDDRELRLGRVPNSNGMYELYFMGLAERTRIYVSLSEIQNFKTFWNKVEKVLQSAVNFMPEIFYERKIKIKC